MRVLVCVAVCLLAVGCGGGGGSGDPGSGDPGGSNLSVTTTSLPGGTVGVAYSSFLAATGGTAPYTWSLPVGALPGGLMLGSASGEIAGTPTAAGPSTFTVQARDANGASALAVLSITIEAGSSGGGGGGGGGGFAWTLVSPTGTAPSGRASHWASPDVSNGRMIVTLGSDGNQGVRSDSFALSWSAGSESWSALPTGPVARWGHTTVLDTTRNRVLLFGGNHNSWQTGNDVWALTLTAGAEAWTQLSPAGATVPVRIAHAAVYDAPNDRMVVFGGGSGTVPELVPTNGVWALDFGGGSAGSWSQLMPAGTPPSARVAMSCVFDQAAGRMIVFGGDAGPPTGKLNDVWALDLSTRGSESWSQLAPTGSSPGARRYAAAAYDPVRNSLFLHGGENGFDYGDLWELSLAVGSEAWTAVSPAGSGPAARDSHSAAYDGTNRRILFYAGFTRWPSTPFTDVWALDLP